MTFTRRSTTVNQLLTHGRSGLVSRLRLLQSRYAVGSIATYVLCIWQCSRLVPVLLTSTHGVCQVQLDHISWTISPTINLYQYTYGFNYDYNYD